MPEGCDYDTKARELVDVMVTEMSRVCPDVAIECGEPVVMTRWSKDAEPVRDANGHLIAWSPSDDDVLSPDDVAVPAGAI